MDSRHLEVQYISLLLTSETIDLEGEVSGREACYGWLTLNCRAGCVEHQQEAQEEEKFAETNHSLLPTFF